MHRHLQARLTGAVRVLALAQAAVGPAAAGPVRHGASMGQHHEGRAPLLLHHQQSCDLPLSQPYALWLRHGVAEARSGQLAVKMPYRVV